MSRPVILLTLGVLVLNRNLAIQAFALSGLQRVLRDSKLSKASFTCTANAKISLVAFASPKDSGVALVTMSSGQLPGSFSHVGPCHQSEFSLLTGSPRLPRSAGFS